MFSDEDVKTKRIRKTWWRNVLGRDYVALLHWRQLVSHPRYHRSQTSRKWWEYTGWLYSITIDSTEVCYCILVSAFLCGGEFWIKFYRITLCSLFPIFSMILCSDEDPSLWVNIWRLEIQGSLFSPLWWVHYHRGEELRGCGGDGTRCAEHWVSAAKAEMILCPFLHILHVQYINRGIAVVPLDKTTEHLPSCWLYNMGGLL